MKTARCHWKLRYVPKFTAASRGPPCDSTAILFSVGRRHANDARARCSVPCSPISIVDTQTQCWANNVCLWSWWCRLNARPRGHYCAVHYRCLSHNVPGCESVCLLKASADARYFDVDCRPIVQWHEERCLLPRCDARRPTNPDKTRICRRKIIDEWSNEWVSGVLRPAWPIGLMIILETSLYGQS